jgi:hypothetical protein
MAFGNENNCAPYSKFHQNLSKDFEIHAKIDTDPEVTWVLKRTRQN